MGGRGSYMGGYRKRKKNNPPFYHGGGKTLGNEIEGDLIFTTDSEYHASLYAKGRGNYVHTVLFSPLASILSINMEGNNFSKGYEYIDEYFGKLNGSEQAIVQQDKNYPLNGLAHIAKLRGYDVLEVRNVTDPYGKVSATDLRNSEYVKPMTERIVLNRRAVVMSWKRKI